MKFYMLKKTQQTFLQVQIPGNKEYELVTNLTDSQAVVWKLSITQRRWFQMMVVLNDVI